MRTARKPGMSMAIRNDRDLAARRAAARRTAMWLGLIALVIFAAFVLSGVIGR